MRSTRPELAQRLAEIALQRVRILAPLIAFALGAALLASASAAVPVTRWIIGVNVPIIAVTCAVAVAAYLRRIPVAWAHASAALVWWAPITTSLTSFSVTHDPKLFVLLLLEVATGSVLLSTPWLVGSCLLVDALWVPLAVLHGGPDAMFSVLTLITAQLFAIVIHRLKVSSLAAAETLRLEAERQVGELQRSELARAELAEQLIHAQRLEAVGTLAAGLAHDMNNVLAAIMGLADGLAETVDDAQARADATDILREAERGAELTRGLLTFSRRGQYRKQVLGIGEIVDDVVAMLGRTLPKTVQVEKQVLDADAFIEGDPTQFSQALVNLAINASDAMSGSGRLILRGETIAIAAGSPLPLAPGRYAQLRVIDTGSGMDEATRARVFEPFFTTKAMGKGTGLGLALVWGVVHKSQGTVTVESELGKGSTFSIYLPLTAKPAKPAAAISGSTRVVRRGTVLVVDDEPAVRKATTRMLERLGLQTLAAAGGAEALELYAVHTDEISLVMLDMGMPGMNGADVFRALRERSNVKVLISTGYALEAEVQQLVEAGARVIEKPFKLAALEQEIERALAGSRTQAN